MRRQGIDWIDDQQRVKDIHIDALSRVCTQICADFNFQLAQVVFTLLSDDELWQMNLKHLQHDTLTDVITFPYNQGAYIRGEIFISTDRALDNAARNNTTQMEEVVRYAVHGVLHLNGLNDSTEEEKQIIHRYEDQYLNFYKLFHVKQ